MRHEGIDNKMTAAAADWQTAASPGPDDADILILIRLRSSSSVCRSCSESSRSSYSSYSTSSRYRATDSGLSRKILTLSNASSLAVPSCPGARLLGQEEDRLLGSPVSASLVSPRAGPLDRFTENCTASSGLDQTEKP